MPVSQAGALNPTANNVPDLYVQIQQPSVQPMNGLPTNIAGIVGSASWGLKNAPVTVSDAADYVKKFGPLMNRKFDAGTAVAAAALQGASNFRVVRVTDGTDTAASASIGGDVLLFTAKYSGSLGNQLQVSQSAGSAAGTIKLTVSLPGYLPEAFDNIAPDGAGKFAAAIETAINQGVNALRGPSALVVATVGATAEPNAFSVGTVTLSGGTDGQPASEAALVGTDIGQRTGMYALRGSGVSVAMLADVTDASTFTTQAAFGLSEGVYMIATGPAGETIDAAVATKATAGLDSYAAKLMFGDWIYWYDPVNKATRLVSPQAFVLGRLANLSPEQSSLNKQLYGIVGTQRSMQESVYSTAELSQLVQAGIDVITNPCPGGAFFGVRIGHNTSSNPITNGDNYTRMTNFLAFTLNAGMGRFVGKVQTPTVRAQAKGTLTSFLSNMEEASMIGNVNGGPAFSVQLDDKNNPMSRVALGYMQADVRVTYLSIVEKFLVNLEGSQSTVVRQSTTNQ